MEIRFAAEIEWVRRSAIAKSPFDYEERIKAVSVERNCVFGGFILPWAGDRTKLFMTCPIHGDWTTTSIDKFLGKKQAGCPKCGALKRASHSKLSEDDALEIIKNKCSESGYEFLGFVGGVWVGYYTKLILRCPKHDHIWETTSYGNFSTGKAKGCIPCRLEKSNKTRGFDPKKYEEKVIELCKERGFEFLGWYGGECKNSRSRMVLKCLEHGEIWDTTTYSNFIRRPDSGCPKCTLYGFRTNRPAWVYVQDVAGKAIKFGITNRKSVEYRMKQQANRSGLNHKILFSWHFEDGRKAYEVEMAVKTRFKSMIGVLTREEMPDGFTETLPIEISASLLKEVKTLCNFA
ncbi:hypothetical protein CB696_00045 [Salmonella enterica subsp. enterica serovar Livingstone]|nr:hypothetical protein [Salmonella enterica subsp. enterica serovar Livingstone]